MRVKHTSRHYQDNRRLPKVNPLAIRKKQYKAAIIFWKIDTFAVVSSYTAALWTFCRQTHKIHHTTKTILLTNSRTTASVANALQLGSLVVQNDAHVCSFYSCVFSQRLQ